MIIAWGCAALLTHFFLMGTIWRHASLESQAEEIHGYVLKSIYLSWIWFFVLFGLKQFDAERILVAAATIGSAGLLLYRFRTSRAVYRIPMDWARRITLIASLVLILVYAGKLGGIFTEWDSVVSWNRWGMELARNEYRPTNAAYPILFPALWSLIYKAQQTPDIWFVAKASLIVLPISSILWLTHIALRIPVVIGALFLLACCDTLFFNVSANTSGYMDAPLAAMGLSALLFFLRYLQTNEVGDAKSTDYLMLACVSGGLASITKQAGIVFCILIAAMIVIEVVKKRLALRVAAYHWAVLFIPPALFAWIFLQTGLDTVGNLGHLRGLSAQNSHGSKLANSAWLLCKELGWLSFPIVALGLFGLLLPTLTSVRVFAVLCCLVFVGGFLAFADCCSYDVRNSYWLLPFLLVPAFVGLQNASRWSPNLTQMALTRDVMLPSMTVSIVGAMLLVVAASVGALKDDWVRNLQSEKQKHIGMRKVTPMLYSLKPQVDDGACLLTDYALVRYLPGFEKSKTTICSGRDSLRCLQSALLKCPRSLVLHTLGASDAKEYVKSAVASGQARMVAETQGYSFLEFSSGVPSGQ